MRFFCRIVVCSILLFSSGSLLPPDFGNAAFGSQYTINNVDWDSMQLKLPGIAEDPMLPFLNQDTTAIEIGIDGDLARDILLELKRDLYALNKITRSQRERQISSQEADIQRFPIAQKIQSRLEDALRANPFDRSVRSWLRQVYRNLEDQYRESEDWGNYIPVAIRYTLMRDQKNRHIYYSTIGNAFYEIQQYEKSHAYYQTSITALFEFFADSLEANSLRYLRILRSRLYRRAEIEEELGRIDAAIISWGNLVTIAPEDLQRSFQIRLERLKWDDRNIKASEKRTEATRLYIKDEFEKSYKLYKEILDSLKTEAARDEINWRLSRIEYFRFNLRYQGLHRLWQVVKKIKMDSIVTTADSTALTYLGTYAQMCYAQGLREFKELGHLREAFMYLSLASEIENPNQSKAFYHLTELHTNARRISHSERAIEYGKKAWILRDDLPPTYQKNLALFLSHSYEECGEFDEALTWYQIYHKL
ncbi:hypothetical protein JXJ21_16285 [candidate division KSB1 bacterium]|nr:hypothetical protein [candidate division KSB1 bacterium]